MATGGDDKKVNLWALGKSFCIMVGVMGGGKVDKRD